MFLKIVKDIYEQNRYRRKEDIEENKQKARQGKVKTQWRREEKKSKI